MERASTYVRDVVGDSQKYNLHRVLPKYGDLVDEHLHPMDIDDSLLAPSDWSTLHSRLFKSSNHITKLEGDALIWSVAHCFRSQRATGRRALFLVDNTPLCFAICKGRSSSPLLIHATRVVGLSALPLRRLWLSDGCLRARTLQTAHLAVERPVDVSKPRPLPLKIPASRRVDPARP